MNVALPSIQRDLHFSQTNLAWVVNAYLITFGGLLLLAGRLGDLIGRRRVFLVGLALFTVASVLCGLSQSQGLLIGARFVQGIGGAMTSAVILGMIVTMFPQPREQAKAIGVYSFVASAGASLGLLLGGIVTQAINWHWIFFINLPIGIATALLGDAARRDDRGPRPERGVDTPGALLLVSALMLAVYTIVEAGDYALGLGPHARLRRGRARAAGRVRRAAGARRQSADAAADVPLAQRPAANLVQLLMVASLFGMFFLGVLFMQHVLGYSAIGTGVAFLPVSLGIGVMSLGFSARLNNRFGPKATLLPGLALWRSGSC